MVEVRIKIRAWGIVPIGSSPIISTDLITETPSHPLRLKFRTSFSFVNFYLNHLTKEAQLLTNKEVYG